MTWTDRFNAFLERPGWLQGLVWFVVVLAPKFGTLLEPPVWDSAMGVFPPAIYLYESGFDIRALLAEGNWWDGGPNVHSLSLYTWIVAGVMTATGSAVATFFILHIATFAAVAWGLVLFTRVLSSYGLTAPTVLAAAGLLLSMPIVLVQVGYLYTDIVVLVLGIAAWAFWQQRQPFRSVLVCVVAIFVKETALAIALCIFLAVLVSTRRIDARRIAMICAIPLAELTRRSLPGWLGAEARPAHRWGEPVELLESLYWRLSMVPDLALLMGSALIATGLWLVGRARQRRGLAWLASPESEAMSQLVCLAMPVVFASAVVYQVVTGTLFLPRYAVPVVPFAIASLVIVAASLRQERVALIAMVLGCLFSIANHGGAFYPAHRSKFSIVERSHAYRDFHAIQKGAISILVEKPPGVPAFVSKEIAYMVSHPMMGYADAPIANVHPAYRTPYADWSLDDYPDNTVFVRTNLRHGGDVIKERIAEAKKNPSYDVVEVKIDSNGFEGAVHWVSRKTPTADRIAPGGPEDETLVREAEQQETQG